MSTVMIEETQQTTKRYMTCSCCGGYAGHFEQHPNRDTGFGLCGVCAIRLRVHRAMPADEIKDLYGDAGVHYEAPPPPTIEPTEAKWFFEDLTADYKAGLDVWREITEDNYLYARDVVPPLYGPHPGFLMGEPYTHTPYDVIYDGFVRIGTRYFARKIGSKQFADATAALVQVVAGIK